MVQCRRTGCGRKARHVYLFRHCDIRLSGRLESASQERRRSPASGSGGETRCCDATSIEMIARTGLEQPGQRHLRALGVSSFRGELIQRHRLSVVAIDDPVLRYARDGIFATLGDSSIASEPGMDRSVHEGTRSSPIPPSPPWICAWWCAVPCAPSPVPRAGHAMCVRELNPRACPRRTWSEPDYPPALGFAHASTSVTCSASDQSSRSTSQLTR